MTLSMVNYFGTHNPIDLGQDINRVMTIKKCFTRYDRTSTINTQLVLNQFIILSNRLKPKELAIILHRSMPHHWVYVVTFLRFIHSEYFDDDLPIVENDLDLAGLLGELRYNKMR